MIGLPMHVHVHLCFARFVKFEINRFCNYYFIFVIWGDVCSSLRFTYIWMLYIRYYPRPYENKDTVQISASFLRILEPSICWQSISKKTCFEFSNVAQGKKIIENSDECQATYYVGSVHMYCIGLKARLDIYFCVLDVLTS
jgi:hypothetical protein